jgi:hypothetical protein
VHPGSSVEDVRSSTGFEYDVPPAVAATSEPTERELDTLRTEVAPQIARDYPDFARRVWG